VTLSTGLNMWTAQVPMRIYKEINRWFIYKAKEERNFRIPIFSWRTDVNDLERSILDYFGDPAT